MTAIREIAAKSILTKTGIEGYDYCINPYVGCEHGCRYCYASFMKRFTGHREPWGDFVDVKVNAPHVLAKQLKRARKGSLLIGTVTDPYQPAEKHYRLTRGCLGVLLGRGFSVNILTRSPLCTRDIPLFQRFEDIAVGISITTDREDIRRIFEPRSPSIGSTVAALRVLHEAGVATYAFIGPMLPLDPKKIIEILGDEADEVLVDRLNYGNRVKGLYRAAGMESYLTQEYFTRCAFTLKAGFEKKGIPLSILF